MPELPEVETVVRGLAPVLVGRRVEAVEGVAPETIVGREIRAVRRYGKYIVMELDRGMLLVHLRMTGQLTLDEARGKFTRGRIVLDEGVLRYDDIRRFGRLTHVEQLPEQGPDPLEMTAEEFVAHAGKRRARVKALLLDQKFLRGMGNIYADEALFAAGVHPCAVAASVSKQRLERLHGAIVAVLKAAIAAGGSSISDYVNARGERGGYQEQHQVYGKHGEACPRCGRVLARILVVQRGTTFCPRCQKR